MFKESYYELISTKIYGLDIDKDYDCCRLMIFLNKETKYKRHIQLPHKQRVVAVEVRNELC